MTQGTDTGSSTGPGVSQSCNCGRHTGTSPTALRAFWPFWSTVAVLSPSASNGGNTMDSPQTTFTRPLDTDTHSQWSKQAHYVPRGDQNHPERRLQIRTPHPVLETNQSHPSQWRWEIEPLPRCGVHRGLGHPTLQTFSLLHGLVLESHSTSGYFWHMWTIPFRYYLVQKHWAVWPVGCSNLPASPQ